jgi:glyoxylase-like metal-dependent hydrolase (beta-lactamase superfamily II)
MQGKAMTDTHMNEASRIVDAARHMPPAVIRSFFDEDTFTVTHVISDQVTRKAAIIDSVLDFDPASGGTSFTSADKVVDYVLGEQLETHAHADHLSAAPYLQKKLGGTLAIGRDILAVQAVFGRIFNEGSDFARDGSQFDHLFEHGERFRIGALDAIALHVPGHTPADMAYVIGNVAFVGDTLFMPDYGTARADFPGGDARALYRSIRRLLSLPEQTELYLCHDYKAPGRDHYAWQTTVGDERAHNVHVHDGIGEDEFVAMREARDATLGMPRLILPSTQVNMRGGHMPDAENNGVSYLKMPINAFQSAP